MNAREKLVDPGHRSKDEKENTASPVMNLAMVEDPNLRPPAFLNKFGKAQWKRVLEQLVSAGMLAEIDLGTLEAYCSCYGDWRDAQTQLKKNGLTMEYTNKQGHTNTIKRPEVDIVQKNLVLMKQYGEQLGLSVKARQKLGIKNKAPKESGLMVLMNRRQEILDGSSNS
jgi:P27 family predicted phage terminase small subunit